MIAVTAAARQLVKSRIPRFAYCIMWYSVIARLLLPFKIPLASSFYSLFNIPAQPYSPPTAELSTSPRAVVYVGAQQASSVTSASSVIHTIWLTIAIVLAVYFIFVYFRFKSKLKPLETCDIGNFEAIRNRLKIKRSVRLYKSESISSPLTYGILIPCIIVPDNFETEDAKSDEYMILHECIHIKHFDAAWKLLAALALCIHWFNPLVWLMFALFNRDIELACDEGVLKAAGHEKRSDYAMSLIKIEETKTNRQNMLYSCFSKNIVEERIGAIMKYRKKGIAALIASALLISVNASVFATSPESDLQVNVKDAVTDSEAADEVFELIWPAEKCDRITAAYNAENISGRYHREIDISGDEAAGSEIKAAADGIVIEAEYTVDKGYHIIIDHGNGYETMYSHCETLYAVKGQNVSQGEVIATVGKTGMATGYHLGFAVIKDGEYIDPMQFYTATN